MESYSYWYYKEREGLKDELLVSKPVVVLTHCREEEEEEEDEIRKRSGSSGSSGSYASSLCSYLGARERKLVCVTSGNSYLGAHLIKELLSHGYLVRATVENQGDLEEMKRLMMMSDTNNNSNNSNVNEETSSSRLGDLESVVVAKMGCIEALCDAFRGCHVVFHTSSFIDPRGLSGYTERTAFLETEGAKNVIEACGRAAYVKRCVFTSSLLSCIWNAEQDTAAVVDETSWSDLDFCRDNKLWLALGKTRAEKAAWDKARELKVRLLTICPGLLMAPSFPNANYDTSLPYLKAGRIMLSRGLLATEDARRLARAQVELYQAMDNGGAASGGRYVTFERVIDSLELARELESGLKMQQGMLTAEVVVGGGGKVSCGRIKRLLGHTGGRPGCRTWQVKRS